LYSCSCLSTGGRVSLTPEKDGNLHLYVKNVEELVLLLVPEYGWEGELDPAKVGTCTYT
jgi:hypothetical protein